MLNKEQRDELASAAGTTTGYLYQLATCKRGCPSASLALAIEDASRKVSKRFKSPVITVKEMAEMCGKADS